MSSSDEVDQTAIRESMKTLFGPVFQTHSFRAYPFSSNVTDSDELLELVQSHDSRLPGGVVFRGSVRLSDWPPGPGESGSLFLIKSSHGAPGIFLMNDSVDRQPLNTEDQADWQRKLAIFAPGTATNGKLSNGDTETNIEPSSNQSNTGSAD